MRRMFLGLALAGLCTGCPASAQLVLPPPAHPSRDQGLGPGDEIEVRVSDQKELSGLYQVADDGNIDFPWVGAVSVQGLTQPEVATALEARLADGYLREPQVTVRVTARQNREVSVLGQVKEPGSYGFKERLTLVQAISLAGGLTALAHRRKVKLIRETDRGKETFEIDLGRILDSKQEDLLLEAGDIVFIPESPI